MRPGAGVTGWRPNPGAAGRRLATAVTPGGLAGAEDAPLSLLSADQQ